MLVQESNSTLYPHSYQVKPMKYGKAPRNYDEVLSSHDYIAQLKVDGYSYYLEKTSNGSVYLFSRNVSRQTGELTEKIDHMPHLQKWAEKLPNKTILCGEVYYPHGTSKNVTTVMGALTDKAIQRQKENGLLNYYIFDMILYNGEDISNCPFEYRINMVHKYIEPFIDTSFMMIAPQVEDNIQEQINKWLASGEEGAVCKKRSGEFKTNSRPAYNFKVKQIADNLDFVIIDILSPEYYYTGKESNTWKYKNDKGELITKAAYYGWAGAIKVGAYDDNDNLIPIGRVASGLTDSLKEDMAKNPDKYIGQSCEIQAMSVDKEAMSFRHPFFVRMRPDKPAFDCRTFDIFS